MKMSMGISSLTAEEIRHLKKYRFHGTDNSILARYLLKHYNMYVEKLVPYYITPNMITMAGYCFMLINLITVILCDITLDKSPAYLSLMNGISLFLYFTCDNIDGLHARATNQCSPLGQLLDHGVDSACALFLSIALGSSLGLGLGFEFITLMLTIMTGFYFTGLEEKYTGVFNLGYISGPTEGLMLVVLIHLLTFLKGNLFACLPNVKNYISYPFFKCTMFVFCFNTVISLYKIFSTFKKRTVNELINSLVTMVLLIVSFLILHQRTKHKILNLLLFGQIFSLKYIYEIYSHVTGSVAITWNSIYALYVMSPILLHFYMRAHYILLLLSSIYYFLVVRKMIDQICEALDINFLFYKKLQ